jgi:hypothetical protein
MGRYEPARTADPVDGFGQTSRHGHHFVESDRSFDLRPRCDTSGRWHETQSGPVRNSSFSGAGASERIHIARHMTRGFMCSTLRSNGVRLTSVGHNIVYSATHPRAGNPTGFPHEREPSHGGEDRVEPTAPATDGATSAAEARTPRRPTSRPERRPARPQRTHASGIASRHGLRDRSPRVPSRMVRGRTRRDEPRNGVVDAPVPMLLRIASISGTSISPLERRRSRH